MMWGQIAGAIGGGIIGAGLDYFSAKQQNDLAQGSANRAMDFSAAQSAQQMAFQERMSNTSHQREVADLQAAGLNPLLSLNSGASSPPGAMGSGVQAPVVPQMSHFLGGVRDNMSFLADMQSKRADINLKDSHRANVDADTRLKKGSIPAAESRGDFVKWLRKLMKARRAEFGTAIDRVRQGAFNEPDDVRGWRTLDVDNSMFESQSNLP